jgi:hypothetical protein
MPETLEKLSPHRDLQCYFERPSAIAALSEASANGFTVSGTWRQHFDWAVVEWNRDNVFEHPAFRNLPDGDLSGLQLTYQETRQNAIPMDSNLYPTVDWPFLRIWAESGGTESLYRVRLLDHATPVEGSYTNASATFELQGEPTPNDYVELAWEGEHHTYKLLGADTLANAVQAITASVNAFSTVMQATRNGAFITLTYIGAGGIGANGNRIGVTANVSGAKTENWSVAWQRLSGGTSPTKWQVSLNLGSLVAIDGRSIPAAAIRKMRWTYAADAQPGAFVTGEFHVTVSNWQVTGSNRLYRVAGPGSWRTEDDSRDLVYGAGGSWSESRGNFSGGSIRQTTAGGASVSWTYRAPHAHRLYLGTRRAPNAAPVSVSVDGSAPQVVNLALPLEDVLVRLPLGEFAANTTHTVTVTHAGMTGQYLYFDFFEVAVPATDLPTIPSDPITTLATDWDTDHSIALPPERTAWMIKSLGFAGRANHYVGALWFYELVRTGHTYASGTVSFGGPPVFGNITSVSIGPTLIERVNLIGDTAVSIARAFELRINNGSTGVWAEVNGPVLTIHARAMGVEGNGITLAASPSSGGFSAQVNVAQGGAPTLVGGADGEWHTDLVSLPRLNRAARDWGRSFVKAMKSYGIDAAAAFSMELQHADTSPGAGIAQRYPSQNPVVLNTPAVQTNFSPESLAYWKQVYLDMAQVMAEAGQTPYLQFGEVQWWYFPYDGSGMPFYDAYTASTFAATYGRSMHVFPNQDASPIPYPEEAQFLSGLIGNFTNQIMQHVRSAYPAARFEVLYPPDVNNTPLNTAVNLPAGAWTPAALDCLKTENFTYTGNRDMNKVRDSIQLPLDLGFPREKTSHLIGIGDYTTPWPREVRASKAQGLESVVLFALDQFCLIGYPTPLAKGARRSSRQG